MSLVTLFSYLSLFSSISFYKSLFSLVCSLSLSLLFNFFSFFLSPFLPISLSFSVFHNFLSIFIISFSLLSLLYLFSPSLSISFSSSPYFVSLSCFSLFYSVNLNWNIVILRGQFLYNSIYLIFIFQLALSCFFTTTKIL